jgi:hypothetical protein
MRLQLLTPDGDKRFVFQCHGSTDIKFIVVDWSEETNKNKIFRKQLIAENLVIMARENVETSMREISQLIDDINTCRIMFV